jgi:hypothetical protein
MRVYQTSMNLAWDEPEVVKVASGKDSILHFWKSDSWALGSKN